MSTEHYERWRNDDERRDGRRFQTGGRVEIGQAGNRIGVGELVDISRSGAAMRCHTRLVVGEQYEFNSADFGNYIATVMRGTGAQVYAFRFDISEMRKKALEEKLVARFGSGRPRITRI